MSLSNQCLTKGGTGVCGTGSYYYQNYYTCNGGQSCTATYCPNTAIGYLLYN